MSFLTHRHHLFHAYICCLEWWLWSSMYIGAVRFKIVIHLWKVDSTWSYWKALWYSSVLNFWMCCVLKYPRQHRKSWQLNTWLLVTVWYYCCQYRNLSRSWCLFCHNNRKFDNGKLWYFQLANYFCWYLKIRSSFTFTFFLNNMKIALSRSWLSRTPIPQSFTLHAYYI